MDWKPIRKLFKDMLNGLARPKRSTEAIIRPLTAMKTRLDAHAESERRAAHNAVAAAEALNNEASRRQLEAERANVQSKRISELVGQ